MNYVANARTRGAYCRALRVKDASGRADAGEEFVDLAAQNIGFPPEFAGSTEHIRGRSAGLR